VTVSVSGLRCAYRGADHAVLEIDALDLAAGTIGLVGVNGAGKSTLLRSLAGARRPQEGRITIDGVSLYGRRRRAVAKQIGFMPQEVQFPGELSVAQVVDYISWLRAIRPRRAATRRTEVLRAVGLEDRAGDLTRRLSGGMRRRLALAVALVSEPDLLLLDEPTTGLDPEQRAGVRAIIGGLGDQTLTVMSSHVMEDVASVTSSLVVLHEGKVLHHGDTGAFIAERGGSQRSAELAFLSTIAHA
jgi:ABC-2 type transport system ATP-binding protein